MLWDNTTKNPRSSCLAGFIALDFLNKGLAATPWIWDPHLFSILFCFVLYILLDRETESQFPLAAQQVPASLYSLQALPVVSGHRPLACSADIVRGSRCQMKFTGSLFLAYADGSSRWLGPRSPGPHSPGSHNGVSDVMSQSQAKPHTWLSCCDCPTSRSVCTVGIQNTREHSPCVACEPPKTRDLPAAHPVRLPYLPACLKHTGQHQ